MSSDWSMHYGRQWLALFPGIIGRFIHQSVTLVVIGICVLLSGVSIRYFLKKDSRLVGTLVLIVVSTVSHHIFLETSRILINPEISYIQLIVSIMLGIFLTAFASLTAIRLRKKYSHFFIIQLPFDINIIQTVINTLNITLSFFQIL